MAASMRFTTFRNVHDKVPVTYEGWDEFTKLFKLKVVANKDDVALYCPAEYINDRRTIENVLHVSFGVIDADDHDEAAIMDALQELADLDIKVIFHTTHRHTESLPRKFKCRIIIPLSRPVEMHEWDKFWHAMNELVGGIADIQCKNPNRIYYFPSCPPDVVDTAIVEVLNEDGDVLDVDDLLAEAPEVERKHSFIPEVDPEAIKRIEANVRDQLAQVFLENYPAAVSGQHGDMRTLRAAMIGGDFGLTDAQFWPLFLSYNERCKPPWDEDDLAKKLANANNYRSLPFGWRLVQQGQDDVVEEKHLKSLAEKLSKKDGQVGIVGRRLEKILKGDPIGTEAEQVFESVATMLARHFTHANPTQLALLLEPSIKATHTAGNRDIKIEWVAQQIREAQEKLQAGRADDQLDRRLLERLTIKDAFRSVKQDRTTPYSKKEVEAFAKDNGLDSPIEFRRRWLLRSGKSFYFFVGGEYVRRTQEEALNSAHELLLPAKLPMFRDGANGPVPLKLNELVERYGSVADRVYADLTATETHYDWQNKTIIEAPCPFRALTPRYNKYVDGWLQALTPTTELHERLLDWLACVPKLKRPCCALFLHGAPRTGKSLLAPKLARMWRQYGGPTELESLAANFNEEMQDCPVVFGDEFVPVDKRGDPNTALLRKIIQEHDRTFKRKGIGDVKLLGAIRLILAANNPDILVASHLALTNNDIDAINERFLCIHVDKAAAGYLENLKHNLMEDPEVSAIFHGDAIAQHVWWLHDNRPVIDNDRLIVSGMSTSELSLQLTVGTGLRSGVCHWFANYILATPDKRKMQAGISPIIDKMADGTTRLLVSAHMIYTLWSQFNPNEEKPRLDSLRKALGGICTKTTTKRIDGQHHALRIVDLLRIKYWTAINDRASEEKFDAALEAMGLPVPYLDPAYLRQDD